MGRDIENKNFKDFLPHREPMLMVKDLLYIDENSVSSGLPIAENCIFVEKHIPLLQQILLLVDGLDCYWKYTSKRYL